MKAFNRKVAYYLGLGMSLAAAQAHAAIDVSAVTTALGDAGTACATVGAAALVVYVGIKVWHLVRRAM